MDIFYKAMGSEEYLDSSDIPQSRVIEALYKVNYTDETGISVYSVNDSNDSGILTLQQLRNPRANEIFETYTDSDGAEQTRCVILERYPSWDSAGPAIKFAENMLGVN